jgi:hypothetical protein
MPETSDTQPWDEDDDALLQQLMAGQAQDEEAPQIPGADSAQEEDPRLDALLRGQAAGSSEDTAWHDEHLDRVLAADLGFEDLVLDGLEDDLSDEAELEDRDPRMSTDEELLQHLDDLDLDLAIPHSNEPAQPLQASPPPPPGPRAPAPAPAPRRAAPDPSATPSSRAASVPRPAYTARSELGSPLRSHVELLARRLAIPVELAQRAGLTDPKLLKDPAALIQAAAQVGPKDPEAASALLAAAVLGQSEQGADPRLSTFLRLLASMVSHSKASLLLGPEGSALRAQLMPNGWLYTIQSWPRSRYAWREGMTQLLEVGPEDVDRLHALDEITALSGSEAEPVSVVIQDVWPPKPVTTILTLIGMIVTSLGLYREFGPKRKS